MCLTGVTTAHKNRFRGQWVATINEGLGIAMKVKQAIEVLQKYDLEEDIFFDVYSKADLDYLGDDIKAKITDEMMTTIYETMDNWATTDDFNDAVRIVLSDNGVDA